MSTKDTLKLKKVKRFLSHLNIATEAVHVVCTVGGISKVRSPYCTKIRPNGPFLAGLVNTLERAEQYGSGVRRKCFRGASDSVWFDGPGQPKVARVSCVKTKLEHG